MDKDFEKQLMREVRLLEESIGLQRGFFQKLVHDDDLTFIVKIHALVESAVSHLLVEEINQPKLNNFITRLELNNKVSGKVALAKALDAIDKEERTTIRKLSEIRNDYVHDVLTTETSLSNWISKLERNKFEEYLKTFGPAEDVVLRDVKRISRNDFFRDNPKICIWFECEFMLAMIYQRKKKTEAINRVREVSQDFFREYVMNKETFLLPIPRTT